MIGEYKRVVYNEMDGKIYPTTLRFRKFSLKKVYENLEAFIKEIDKKDLESNKREMEEHEMNLGNIVVKEVRENKESPLSKEEELLELLDIKKAIDKYINKMGIKEETIFEWRPVLGLRVVPSKHYRY